MMSVTSNLNAALRQYWGYEEFRPRQEEIVRAVLAGRDCAVIMPTGAGKSLCYQLPAVLKQGTAVVVSPLIALMEDQVAHLDRMGIPSAHLSSSVPYPDQRKIMARAITGSFRLIYISPERLAKPETLAWLQKLPLSFFAIDEAHCISEWGHEFRPEYRLLGNLRNAFPNTPIAAFTASATRRVRHDILSQLGLRDPAKFISSFQRPNLNYLVKSCDGVPQESLILAALAAHTGKTVILYAPTIARVEEIASWLTRKGFPAVPYHGQMDPIQRKANQERWMSGEIRVLVGTIAFGLGINKPDVRAVIHLSLPKSLEQYYQESGRAGRDGLQAECLLLWQKKDIGLLAHFIESVADPRERERAWQRYHSMRRFVDSTTCRQRQICAHFGETPKWDQCGHCDICSNLPQWLTHALQQAATPRPSRRRSRKYGSASRR